MATPVEPTPDSHQHPTHVPLSNWRNPWVVLASVLVLVFIVFGLISHAAVHFGPQMYTRITGTVAQPVLECGAPRVPAGP